jgi:hypothetical protein
MGEILVFSNSIFSESSWPPIIFNTVFSTSMTRTTQNSRQETKIGQDLQYNNLLLLVHNGTVHRFSNRGRDTLIQVSEASLEMG